MTFNDSEFTPRRPNLFRKVTALVLIFALVGSALIAAISLAIG
ncbi:MAG: hypothetical protein SPG61_00465 [Arcanobacterium sp.]|nr:hypothetical protein [Arcanobacterium sp.]